MSELIRRFKDEYMRTKKSLGQHFLTNKQFIKEIADSAKILPTSHIVEIGPGCGVLTEELYKHTNNLTVIDLDSNAATFLNANKEEFFPQIQIIHDDALNVQLSTVADKVIVVGNLPYNMSVKILEHCTNQIDNIERAVFMFQKEVASRISAKHGSKERSSLSVYCEYFYEIEKVRDVGGGNFWPNANVMSTILTFTPRKSLPLQGSDEKQFLSLVRQAFSQKRKTLQNNLKECISLPAVLNSLDISATIRGEELTLNDFLRIYERIRS
ncbi:MAG: 16S rRNA (adenine(1518)-N(6)/adenine(1519)-N(6))-dimethyltransferase RsmA [Deferribacteraceae bacterium]|jgi:16S rRNA (adenine1518-N6/adenine1519-N6)-dimethyltransferase|nr:16S rRNA (adenine(1518)-N(6)/adenine(1519)-N(6))-dimethyltransferase RsmA [Deferribacteraceae bacterium]